jgi:hypothetical protein
MEENKKSLGEKLSLPLSIVVAGLLIAGGIYLNGKGRGAVNPYSYLR